MDSDKTTKIEKNSVTKKIFFIISIAILLLIPLLQVENQIGERRYFEDLARQGVAASWGDKVTLSSPILYSSEKVIYPNKSETLINVESKEKKRGVFKVPVYTTNFKSKITFIKPEPLISEANKYNSSDKNKTPKNTDYMILHINQISSIQKIKVKEVKSGKELNVKLMEFGIRLSEDELSNKDFYESELEIELTIRGTGILLYNSNSNQENIKMSGNWTKPKFIDEGILPSDTLLSPNGFEATWSFNSIETYSSSKRKEKSIGFDHLWLNTDYSMIEKAVKYGILFIALTFVLVLIIEFKSTVRIHPFQYGLIGLSICIFYLLILALSESIGFNLAYLISSLAVTGLMVFYVTGFIKQKTFVKLILLEQTILNVFFYVLLAMEEKAFLIGSIGLFIALSLFMSITRKLDWYSGTYNKENEPLTT